MSRIIIILSNLFLLFLIDCNIDKSENKFDKLDTILCEDLITIDNYVYIKKTDSLPYTGFCIELDKGIKTKQFEYKEGYLTGKFIEWDSIGNKVTEGYIYKSKKDSIVRSWYPSGKLKRIAWWEKGKLTGQYEEWYETGQIKTTGQYKNWLKNELWIYFKENGDTLKKVLYSNNNIINEKVF
jgi:antitoxin component YwqK of YwqJK toxin-antitoxin module